MKNLTIVILCIKVIECQPILEMKCIIKNETSEQLIFICNNLYMHIKCEALTASPLNVCFNTFLGLDFNCKSGTISKPLEMLQGF